MKNLGKILGLLLALSTSIWASGVSAKLDTSYVQEGDSVTLNIIADGKKVIPPMIDTLCGADIESTSKSSSVEIINGNYSQKITFSYRFTPMQSCTIQPIKVRVDGHNFTTNPIDLKVGPHVVNKNADFILELSSSAKEAYVGEPITVSLKVKQKYNATAADSKFEEPTFKNFWIKTKTKPRTYQNGIYKITQIDYVLAGQKVGDFKLGPALLNIAKPDDSRDAWGQFFSTLKWKKYSSNRAALHIKALPGGVDLIGDFTMKLKVAKKEVAANDALNATLVIEGSGDFEDIPSMKPEIDDVTTYDEDPKTSEGVRNGKNVGRWSQKFAFVADSNFTIPSFTLRYFDLKTRSVKTLKTAPVAIHVKQSGVKKAQTQTKSTNHEVKIERAADVVVPHAKTASNGTSVNYITLILVAVVSALVGAFLARFDYTKYLKKERAAKVSHKDLKSAMIFLLEHKDDTEVAQMIEQIDKKLYGGEDVTIDTKALKALIQRYS